MASPTTTVGGGRFLNNSNRLSAAGAASSLKYANPKDLPSYPSAGLPSTSAGKNDSAAGTAANLGWTSQKGFEHEHRKSEPSASAATAATVGWSQKAPSQWQPEPSTSGARAAVLAARGDKKVGVWKPEASAWGNSAATLAMRNERGGMRAPSTDPRPSISNLDRRGSLMAATGAMSRPKKPVEPTPVALPRYPDEANARANALRAATHADSVSRRGKSELPEGGASPRTNMPKEMFASTPPVALETDEKIKSESRRASAIAMAQQMYKTMQKQDEDTSKHAAASAHDRQRSTSLSSAQPTPMKLTNLHEAARGLAQQRLAKLHDEEAQSREYRDYYGSNPQPVSKLLSRGRFRRRASSDASLEEDEETSRKIRAQMSLFSSSLSKVDDSQRQKDRDALLAVAQRNVTKSLQVMDERVFAETGKVTPAMMSDWEARSRAAADQHKEPRMEQYGKIDIGGGVFVDQSAVDAIALKNVQPVLDEIDVKTEAERARQMDFKMDAGEKKRQAQIEKARDKELKEANRKIKEQGKQEMKARKNEEKAAKMRSKRTSKQSTKTGDYAAPQVAMMSGAVRTTTTESERESAEDHPHNYMVMGGNQAGQEIPVSQDYNVPAQGQPEPSSAPPESPRGVKGWLKSTFRSGTKGQKEENKPSLAEPEEKKPPLTEPVGTVTTDRIETAMEDEGAREEIPVASLDNAINDEQRDEDPSTSTASVLSSGSIEENRTAKLENGDEFGESRDRSNESDVAQPNFGVQRPISPARDSKFREAV